MSSSNRHWPSMFKSKPCNGGTIHTPQRQHDIANRTLLSSLERVPEPKPRWNPKPEQIRILESIFNSGLVNPPRDEIRKIRIQLQQYGMVGDANVFYWFQNRKSRSKNRDKQPKKPKPKTTADPPSTNHETPPVLNSLIYDNPVCFPDELSGVVMSSASQTLVSSTPSSTIPPLQTHREAERSTVFINNVAFQITLGRSINVRDAFGGDAVLFAASGEVVPTNEWGFTLQPLQNGAFYYLLPSIVPELPFNLGVE